MRPATRPCAWCREEIPFLADPCPRCEERQPLPSATGRELWHWLLAGAGTALFLAALALRLAGPAGSAASPGFVEMVAVASFLVLLGLAIRRP